MTTEEKAKAYDEALERAREWKEKYGSILSSDGTIAKDFDSIFPELSDNEDERIRKAIIELLKEVGQDDTGVSENVKCMLAWLEKQKINIEGDFARGYDCGYEACLNSHGAEWFEKQREPHYNKRNALFDKCVENCDPKTVEEVNKRVDDIMNMPELSAFEQALTNFIGYWEDDEEHWPSQFVKKHGKHILDMAREELQKEQKPAEWKLPDDFEEAVYKVANFISPFDSQDELRRVSHRFAEQLMSLAKKELDMPAEWGEEDEAHRKFILESLEDQIRFCTKDAEGAYYAKQIRTAQNWLKSLHPQPHWKPSEEQIYSLGAVVNGYYNCVAGSVGYNLKELYEQLKKLKECQQ